MAFLCTTQVAKKARPRIADRATAQEIRQLSDRGWSCRKLAQKFNCHRSTISNIRLGRGAYSYLGTRVPRPQPLPISEREREIISELDARGYSPQQIGVIVHRHPQTVAEAIEENEY